MPLGMSELSKLNREMKNQNIKPTAMSGNEGRRYLTRAPLHPCKYKALIEHPLKKDIPGHKIPDALLIGRYKHCLRTVMGIICEWNNSREGNIS